MVQALRRKPVPRGQNLQAQHPARAGRRQDGKRRRVFLQPAGLQRMGKAESVPQVPHRILEGAWFDIQGVFEPAARQARARAFHRDVQARPGRRNLLGPLAQRFDRGQEKRISEELPAGYKQYLKIKYSRL